VVAVSLIDGWFPALLVAVAAVSAAAMLWPLRRSWRRFRWPLAATVVVVVVAYVYFDVLDPLQYRFPRSFYFWLGAVTLVVGITIATWRTATAARRTIAVVTALSSTLAAVNLVNAHYAYYPTVAALRGTVSPYHVSPAKFEALRELADTTGELPSSGVVIQVAVPPTRSGFTARDAFVYLPPIWFAPDRPPLPALMLIPGTPSSPGDWFRAGGADHVANDYAIAHGGHGPILVLPDANGSTFADTECVDGPRGNAETYLVDDVVDFAVHDLGAAPERQHWALVGLSAGGTCAMTLALRHPDRFAAFANFSGDAAPNLGSRQRTIDVLYGGDASAWDAHDPETLLAANDYTGMRAWFAVGSDDRAPRRAAERLSAAAQEAGIDTELVIHTGNHSYRFWRAAFADAFEWLASSVGLDPTDGD